MLGSWIQGGVDRGPLLPESLNKADFSNDSIFVEAVLSTGEPLYRHGEPYQPWFGVEKPFGDDYRGVLEEVTVRLAIDPEVAPQLVIGGAAAVTPAAVARILVVVAGLLLSAISAIAQRNEP